MPVPNILPTTLEEILSRNHGRLYQRERKLTPRASAAEQQDNNLSIGVVQDGHAYVFDELVGAARPSAPQLVPFSWPGIVVTGDPSGPHLVVLPNTSKIYMLTAGVGTIDPDADIVVEFICNGTGFAALTIPAGDMAAPTTRYDSSWPVIGGNDTDYLQVQCTAAGLVGADLVAAVRIV